MAKPLSAEDVLPLVARLTPEERPRLLRLISERSAGIDRDTYRALPSPDQEFSNNEEPIEWEAEGWAG